MTTWDDPASPSSKLVRLSSSDLLSGLISPLILQIYSTGRNLKSFLNAAHQYNLPEPHFAICGVGTEIYTFGDTSKPENSHLSRIDREAWLEEYKQTREPILATELFDGKLMSDGPDIRAACFTPPPPHFVLQRCHTGAALRLLCRRVNSRRRLVSPIMVCLKTSCFFGS